MSRQSDLVELTREKEQALSSGSKNVVRNGAMQVSQRGNRTNITTNSFGGPDGWKVWTNLGTLSLNQSTDAPEGFSNSLELDVTTAGTVSSSSYMQIATKIEGQDVQHFCYGTSAAKDVTLSFWVKSNKAGTYQVNFRLPDTNKMASKAYTIDAANTWEHKSLTMSGSVSDVIDNDNGTGFMLDFWLASGTDYDSGVTSDTYIVGSGPNYNAASTVDIGTSTSDYWRITGVQLEVGSESTDFEHLPLSSQLARCLRYYWQVLNVASGVTNRYGIYNATPYNTSAVVYGVINYPVPMRTAPSFGVINYNSIRMRYGSDVPIIGFNFHGGMNEFCAMPTFTASGSITGGRAGWVEGTGGAQVWFDAEL